MMKRRALLWIPLMVLASLVAAFVSAGEVKGPPKHRAGDPGVTEPAVIHQESPVYPEEARKEKIQGVVELEVVVEADGSVGDITVLEDPDPSLSQAAVEAVRQWRYEPARLEDGTVVAVYMHLTVNFRLSADCS